MDALYNATGTQARYRNDAGAHRPESHQGERRSLDSGRSSRRLNVLDEGDLEALAIEPEFLRPSTSAVARNDDVLTRNGAPRQFRYGHGHEYIAEAMRACCEARGIALAYTELGKSNQHADIERFSCTLRGEVDTWVVTALEEVRKLTKNRSHRHKVERTHEGLRDVTSLSYLPRAGYAAESIFKMRFTRYAAHPPLAKRELSDARYPASFGTGFPASAVL
jgi:transposase InsO family protein